MTTKPLAIVLATTNKDKYRTVNLLFNAAFEHKYDFLDLEVLGSNQDLKEKGFTRDRAARKARYYKTLLKQQQNDIKNAIVAVVGIDDGFRVDPKEKIIVESHAFTKALLSGRLLSNGEIIRLIRAFAVLDWRSEVNQTFVTEVPYKYIHPNSAVRFSLHSYPLERVLSPIDENKTISELDTDVTTSYLLKYCKSQLHEMESFINLLIDRSRVL